MPNLTRTDALVAEVNNLLVALGKLDASAEQTRREELRSAWGHGIFDANEATNTCRRVRAQIGTLTSAPVATHAQRTGASAIVTEAVVPEGRYAIDGDGTNDTVFYVVKWWDGRNGRMSSVYLQVSDDERKVPHRAGLTILGRIADAGAYNASIRYGRELGCCGVCGRTLTNDESRAAGIGPVCASKF